MKYNKSSTTTGAWVDKSKLQNGQRAKIVSETKPQPSNFKDEDGNMQMQDVAKVRFEGMNEIVNVAINKTTLNGLIDAFGDDSAKWQGNYLTCFIEKGRYGGKASYSLYLIPEGYEMQDDESGYAQIVKIGTQPTPTKTSDDEIPVIEEDKGENIDLKDIPF